jgi:hypothetical protein
VAWKLGPSSLIDQELDEYTQWKNWQLIADIEEPSFLAFFFFKLKSLWNWKFGEKKDDVKI